MGVSFSAISLRKAFKWIGLGVIIVLASCLCFSAYLTKEEALNNREVSVASGNVNAGVKPSTDSAPPVAPNHDFFAEARMERERVHSQQLDLWREVIKNANSDEITRQKAQEGILKLSQDAQKEMEIENLVKAKGFQDVIVFIQDNNVNAVVRASNLSKEEVAQIGEIIAATTGVKLDKISIVVKQ